MRVAFFVFAAEKNTLGRAYALWLAASALGWETRFVAPSVASPWPPVADERAFLDTLTADATGAAAWADLLVALKPWPGALDVALVQAARHRKPVALDVDDPDWENSFGESPRWQARRFLELARGGHPPVREYALRASGALVRRVLVSNPALHRWYPRGVVVPHARLPRPAGRPHADGGDLEVAFVGTVTDHKGIDVLRAAARAAGSVRLVITADAPADATAGERWIGRTSIAAGLAVVDASDVVVIASRSWTYGAGQLPAKLIDAMMSGRAIIASDLPPIRWALGDTGVLVPPGDTGALTAALDRLHPAAERSRLGERARSRALARFTPEAVAPALAVGLGCRVA